MIEKQQQFKKLQNRINNGTIYRCFEQNYEFEHLNTYLTDRSVDTSRGVFFPLDFSTDYTVRKETLIQQLSKLIPKHYSLIETVLNYVLIFPENEIVG